MSSAPETRRIANILNRLVHGSASSFNRQTNVNLDNSYVVIDISELSGDLLTVGMYIGLDYMWDKAKEDLTCRKQIFIDEVWQIIGASSNALAANYVFEAVKTIRGYGGGVLVATQDLNDFFSLEDGKYGRGILNNCKIKSSESGGRGSAARTERLEADRCRNRQHYPLRARQCANRHKLQQCHR